MLRFALLPTILAAVIAPASAWSPVERHVVGITEGEAHRGADAVCRPLGGRARVHMFLNNGLAFECFDPRSGEGDRPLGLTWGPLYPGPRPNSPSAPVEVAPPRTSMAQRASIPA
jgi:hypothetical protein